MFAGVVKFFLNQLSWKTKRKLVVFEVDDYGSCQYYDENSLRFITDSKYEFTYFTRHDRLASGADLEELFEVLTSVKDSNGNHAIFSPMVIATNPDYAKIKESEFQMYFYEPFFDTIQRIHGQKGIECWKEGIRAGIFMPQYHGREHMHVPTWLSVLVSEGSRTRIAFDNGVCGFIDDKSDLKNNKFSAAYGFRDPVEVPALKEDLADGIKILNDFCGYPVTTFTPPAGGYSYLYESILSEKGIKAVSIGRKHKVIDNTGLVKQKLHYLGKQGAANIRYTPRTALFEPHNGKGDAVARCLRDIELSFSNKLPAIVSSHRINFVNQLNPANGDGLARLRTLLIEIVKRWPDVEFISSAKLSRLIHGESF